VKRSAVVLAVFFASKAFAQDPGLGTWTMNREKSTFSPGPAPQSMTATYESIGVGVRTTVEGIGAKGRPFMTRCTVYVDGQEWPITGSPVANTVSFRRIDANTVERTDRMNGRFVQAVTRIISPDGLSAMVIEKGDTVYNVVIFDKQ
jgi:hypothetical protein